MRKLFSEYPWIDVEQSMFKRLKKEIDAWDENKFFNTKVEELCNYFVELYRIDIPILKSKNEEIEIEQEEIEIDVRDYPYCEDLDWDEPSQVPGVRIEITVPFTGNSAGFNYCPESSLSIIPFNVNITKEYLIFVITRIEFERDSLLHEINITLDKIDDYLTSLRSRAEKLNSELESNAREWVVERHNRLLKNRNLVESLPFKLKERDDSPKTFKAPEVRKKIIPEPQPNSQSYKPEPILDEMYYNHILEVIENMAKVMEYSPAAFSEMSEETLRWHFLVQLNGHYEGQATGETFNYGGKTDILVKSQGKNIFIAECKYWKGPKKLTATIDQLLGYSSWGDTKVAVIIFNKNKNFSKVLDSIKSKTKEHPNHKRKLDHPSKTSFRFVFSHLNDPDKELTLNIMAFDVPNEHAS